MKLTPERSTLVACHLICLKYTVQLTKIPCCIHVCVGVFSKPIMMLSVFYILDEIRTYFLRFGSVTVHWPNKKADSLPKVCVLYSTRCHLAIALCQ